MIFIFHKHPKLIVNIFTFVIFTIVIVITWHNKLTGIERVLNTIFRREIHHQCDKVGICQYDKTVRIFNSTSVSWNKYILLCNTIHKPLVLLKYKIKLWKLKPCIKKTKSVNSSLSHVCNVKILAIVRMGEQWTFSQRDNRIPNLNASIRAQHIHEPTMRAVRVNVQIIEVKQLRPRLILRCVTI